MAAGKCFKNKKFYRSQFKALTVSREPNGLFLCEARPAPSGACGLDALAKIRAIDDRIKVIMMSGHGKPELIMKAIAGGAFRYVTKPFSLSSMRQMVEDAVREHPAA
jgi:DNA-binding NtrC family response regulator